MVSHGDHIFFLILMFDVWILTEALNLYPHDFMHRVAAMIAWLDNLHECASDPNKVEDECIFM